ncbi:hypothetical protein NEF87_000816 [Candidatus Lokiarchaeum ossiferum]|uniref:Glycoside hydrolase family 38 central domain-containing protein n=1 Tax=Candidatus Lokiarchaeum ossiferum TaxID=2951803 RepID=A0ABY6HLZ2_9ARCH|nr:hypothetical protein NEF87_000816 [Candidatus Lokiarchaeum sp. B-35]
MIKKEIYLVPYAHLDTQWRWEYPTTIKKYIKNTIEENLELYNKYPEHSFNFTGAIRYSMMKEYYPEKFAKIKQLIADGRWHIAGTCLDETDALVPSVESMIRNILYGDRWVRKEFGKTSKDYMIPDCFGFPANMPSVLTHCGIQGFSSQKLTWNSAVGIPFEIGIWKGPDGAELVSALNPRAYVSQLFRMVQHNKKRLAHLQRLGLKNGIWKSFQYYGVGDIGGAPKEASVRNAIKSMKASTDELTVRQGAADQFFIEITEQEKQKMDEYTGDLLLINHSAGTLTSAAIMKRWNRKNEQLAFAAETAAISGTLVAGAVYPAEKIRSAWHRMIGNQMHDILPGTCTPTAYLYSQNDEVVALNTWTSVLEDAATAIAPYIPGDGSILLFNPLGESRNEAVEVGIDLPEQISSVNISIYDSEGTSFPAQFKKYENGKCSAIFSPKLPPFSWKRYSFDINETNSNTNNYNSIRIETTKEQFCLENTFYRVQVTHKGKIESIFHKKLEKELLKKPLAYEFQKEKPRAFPSWNMDWNDRKKPPYQRIEAGDTVSILENGPIRCTLQITTNFNKSVFVKEISLSQDSEVVEFTERIKWRELGCSCKFALTSNIENSEVTYNWETSRIKRGLNNPKLYEMPSRLWVDVSDQDWGISLMEDSKFGYDHPADDTLRMTLIYTPSTRLFNGFRDQKYHDWGEHVIRYGIYGHKGDFRSTDIMARSFNQPIRSFAIKDEISSYKKDEFSLLEVSSKQIGITAVKKSEDSDGIIIRLYERFGKEANATISITFPTLKIASVWEVDGLEEKIRNTDHTKTSFKVQVPANGIRSYHLILQNDQKSPKILQSVVNLDYNYRMISKNHEVQGLYPNELVPSHIQAGNILYQLVKEKNLNSVRCKGQVISLPHEYNTLSILIAAEEECKGTFTWRNSKGEDFQSTISSIPSMTKKVGLWDTRIWKNPPKHSKKFKRDYIWYNKCIGVEPGFINRNRLEWYSTHTHQNGEDQYYQYGYMYSKKLDIPTDAQQLILPDDGRIFIFAITASNQIVRVNSTQKLNDSYDF